MIWTVSFIYVHHLRGPIVGKTENINESVANTMLDELETFVRKIGKNQAILEKPRKAQNVNRI